MGLQAIRGVHGATDNKPQAAARSNIFAVPQRYLVRFLQKATVILIYGFLNPERDATRAHKIHV